MYTLPGDGIEVTLDPALDPNPCEAEVNYDYGLGTCGVHVATYTPGVTTIVLCPAHDDAAAAANEVLEPTFDDFLARMVEAEYEVAPWCDFCGGEGHTAVAHDR